MTFIRAKDNTFVWLTVSPRTEQVSIYLRYISGGLTKETFIGYSLRLRPSKTGTAIVHYYFFSLAGPRDKHSGKTRFDPPNGCSPVRLCLARATPGPWHRWVILYWIRRFAKVNIIYGFVHTCNWFLLMSPILSLYIPKRTKWHTDKQTDGRTDKQRNQLTFLNNYYYLR